MLELKATDMIVVSEINQETGIYQNILVTNRPRWKTDSQLLESTNLLHIEILPLGVCDNNNLTFYSLEEFEEQCQLN